MASLQVEIIEPRAGRLLQELAGLNLITITKPINAKKEFRALLAKLRSQSDTAPSLEEIVKDVKTVRKRRYAKTL